MFFIAVNVFDKVNINDIVNLRYTGTLTTLMVLPVNILMAVIFKNVKRQKNDYDYLEDMNSNKAVTKKGSYRLPRWCLIPTWIGEFNLKHVNIKIAATIKSIGVLLANEHELLEYKSYQIVFHCSFGDWCAGFSVFLLPVQHRMGTGSVQAMADSSHSGHSRRHRIAPGYQGLTITNTFKSIYGPDWNYDKDR